MKTLTMRLYDEWCRIDSMRKPCKALIERKYRIGNIIIRIERNKTF